MENLRYKHIGRSALSISLDNDYSVTVIANWSKQKDNFTITLYLQRDDVGMLSLIEEKENIKFHSNVKSIYTDIAKYISQLYTEGFFEKYINRYEYELKCFDAGCEILEKECVTHNNVSDLYKLP